MDQSIQFRNYCEKNDILKIADIHYTAISSHNFIQGITRCAELGHLEVFKYLIENPDFYKFDKSLTLHTILEKSLFAACNKVQTNIFKYVYKKIKLNNDELKNHFLLSCVVGNNNVDILKDLGQDIVFGKQSDKILENSFVISCEKGNIEAVIYLLELCGQIEFAQTQKIKKEGFKKACYLGQRQIVEFLLLDEKLMLSKKLLSWLNNEYLQTNEYYSLPKTDILNIIKRRELYFSLKDNIPSESKKNKKIKL